VWTPPDLVGVAARLEAKLVELRSIVVGRCAEVDEAARSVASDLWRAFFEFDPETGERREKALDE
jgi:hypothetical protein